MFKALLGGLSAAAILGFAGLADAQTCTAYPNTLTNGATADATQVMANFNCAALTGAPQFTGALKAPAGAAGAPAITFGDATTGLYRPGANQIGVAAGGANVATFSATALTVNNSGSPSSPSLTIYDSTTGFYRSGPSLGVALGGASVAAFLASGLSVGVPGSAAFPSITFGDLNTGFYRPAANQIGVATNGGSVATFSSSGLATNSLSSAAVAITNAGSLSSPSLYFIDNTTGFYRPGAGQIGVVAGGTAATFSATGLTVTNGGTAAAPSLTIYDGTIGFYRNGPSLGVSAGGANVAGFSASGLSVGAVSSPTAPSITLGDFNTGFYRPGLNQIGVTTNGGSVATFSTAGIVTPLTISSGGLTITSPGGASAPSLTFIDNTAGFYRPGAGQIGVAAGGTPVATFSATGLSTSALATNAITTTSIGASGGGASTSYASTGTYINRNVADANPALVVGQLNAGATGDILDLQHGFSTVVSVSNAGNLTVGGGTAPSGYVLYANGAAGGASAWTNLSDGRLKKNITEITDALSLVEQLRGVRYQWRETAERSIGKSLKLPSGKAEIGLVGQEVAKVLPEAVSMPAGPEGMYGLKEGNLVAVLVEAVKEQQAEIKALEAKVAALSQGK